MATPIHDYVIVGGGLAGASAVQGLREIDRDGSVLLIGAEPYLPYHRPPLSKGLWTGKKQPDQIFVEGRDFYERNGISLALGKRVRDLDVHARTLTDTGGAVHRYRKLLLATGGRPRRLSLPGGDLEGICYFRSLDDFHLLHGQVSPGATAVVIGGGFIGSELAAALCENQVKVTMIFPGPYLCDRVFPQDLAAAIQEQYRARGIEILHSDRPATIQRDGGGFLTTTRDGKQVKSDLMVVGIGIDPETKLAQKAGLEVDNGVVVDEYLRTSASDVYAAGDLAMFPYAVLGRRMRMEHWDNALNQGKCAGRNLAGMQEAYSYQPYFFSDLFDFGYEATGDVDARLETFADWQEEYRTGVIYYLRDGRVAGVLMCNVWEKVDAARALVRSGGPADAASLKGAIS